MIENLGKYFIMLRRVLTRPEKGKLFWTSFMNEIEKIGLSSVPIVAVLSVFMGAVIAMQTAANMDSPLLPAYTIGFITRQSTILEFSPTIISLILAGKVGSNIASELGTMRVTEQIDALEIMGVNPLNYLVLPKVIAAVLMFPLLITISMALSLWGGWFACVQTGLSDTETYIYGIRAFFNESGTGDISYALSKTLIFAFLITTVSSFYGYYTKGGALDVGKSSTKAVVQSTIVVLIANLIITQLVLI